MEREDMKGYIEAMAAMLELPVTAERLDAVLVNFERLAGLAGLVNAFALGPEDEAGPVWRP